MREYIFTFGFGQKHQGGYHAIEAQSADEARDIMMERFGNKWAFQYTSREAAGVEEHGLFEVKHDLS